MRKKVLDCPKRESTPPEVSRVGHHYRITLQVGTQSFALDISCTASRLFSATAPSPVIETKFLHLRQPAALGDRIDAWRVCWLGGWGKGKVLYTVMVERQAGSISDSRSL
jgi:hypothetical protein